MRLMRHASSRRPLLGVRRRAASAIAANAVTADGQRFLMDVVAHQATRRPSFVLLDVTAAILKHAARLDPTELRTVDAIHLATALSLRLADLDFLTYDTRLATAARTHGLTVLRPGV